MENQQENNENSLSSSTSSIVSSSSSSRSNSKSPDLSQLDDEKTNQNLFDNKDDDNNKNKILPTPSSITSRRSNIRNIITCLYNLNDDCESQQQENEVKDDLQLNLMIEGYLDILPSGKSQKNSILLTWKRRYFKLHLGSLYVYEVKPLTTKQNALNVYNLMGGKVEYEDNRVICIDDSRGNCLIVRSCDDIQYTKWKNAIEWQIIDRSQTLWMRPKFGSEDARKQNVIEKVCIL
jgi:hypothetical protein